MVFDYMDHDLTGLMEREGHRFTVPQVENNLHYSCLILWFMPLTLAKRHHAQLNLHVALHCACWSMTRSSSIIVSCLYQ